MTKCNMSNRKNGITDGDITTAETSTVVNRPAVVVAGSSSGSSAVATTTTVITKNNKMVASSCSSVGGVTNTTNTTSTTISAGSKTTSTSCSAQNNNAISGNRVSLDKSNIGLHCEKDDVACIESSRIEYSNHHQSSPSRDLSRSAGVETSYQNNNSHDSKLNSIPNSAAVLLPTAVNQQQLQHHHDMDNRVGTFNHHHPNNLKQEDSSEIGMKDDTYSSITSRTVDSGSQGSSTSSNPFIDPPSLADVADDLSELSDLELNFDGPIEWPEGDLISTHPELAHQAIRSGAPIQLDTATKLLLYQGDKADLKSVDPRTQARLEALLEAAGIGKLSTTDGKAFADPEVLRKLTSSVSCALDEAAASLTRMRAENQANDLQGNRTLADACSEGDIEAVKRLLNEGRSVHETNEDGESLLSLACCAGYYELAEVLLRMKANVEDRGRKGDCTPLMEAASSGYADITQLLISYDADVNAQSSAGHTALHHAAVGGYEDVVQMLIGAGANVEQQNENGHTPLMESASAGHVGVAKILLDAGAGINTHSNEFKESALTLACYKGHLDMVKFLLDAGADQEHKTDEMHTALMEASMDGHVEVARLLLDSGAQVNMPIDSFESPLTLAACGGHVELASLLLERGAKMEEVNDEGYTALMEASREGHEEMVSLLLTHGALVNTQTDETQETALTLACCGGFMEVASALISNKADIELGCSTPLMEASQEGHLELVNFLINQGSDVHALTATSDTALTYACENGHTDVAEMLLNAGAKLENESEGGRTPLMKAARAGHLCTVQFLISKGADVNRSTTNNEHTVLSLACAGGHLGVVELLLEHGADPLHKLKDGSTMLIEAAKGGHTNVVNLLLDYPNSTTHKPMAPVNEFHDAISMADGLPPDMNNSANDLSLKSTETLANRLELFIRKMMSQADNSSGTREEQMARKQEILDELQRVEQELKFRTQIAQQESSRRSPADSSSGLLSTSPPSVSSSHELVDQGLQQKQMAIAKQQKHEEQLQQQKEYYQAKLQHLKQQYQEKQLQLQQQRQQLLSQAASNSSTEGPPPAPTEEEPTKRQPIPLHIALQNHLHAHHVTEGNVNDLAQALQEWDTRDRNINLSQSLIKPMPTFNLTARPDDTAIMEPPGPELSLHVEDDLTTAESPQSRSLAHSLATFIQGMDTNKSAPVYDPPTLEKAMESSSNQDRPSTEDEMTYKTLEWLKMVDERCAAEDAVDPKSMNLESLIAPKAAPKQVNEIQEKLTSTTKITKVLNGFVDPTLTATDPLPPSVTVRPPPAVPHPQRSASPQHRPFVDPNAATDSNHDTALTLACAGGHAELVKLLLSRHAEIEHRDKKGFTPLILASTAGHSEVVEILIEAGADIEAQSERTKDTPLSLACSGGRYEVVEILLRLGANKEHRNVSDYTPLSLAASGGYVNIIKLLLRYAAEINSRTGSKLGISPLMLAAMNGHTAAVRLLLDMGSDINAQIETNRNTALTLACFQGRHDVVSLLVDRKANIEHRAKTGLTPLMEAASGGYVEVGRVLLDKAADVNAPPVPSSKDTALTIAADKGHYRFVDLLLKRGAAVDVKNKKGNSPLWLACNGGHLDVVQLLVANKADIDSQDNRRVSSLMTAFRKGHVKVVKWLVRHVTQYPSDQECARYIATVSDKELLKKCQQCMSLIVQAKEQQAREALKNASILLEQIETEKSREERRKEAAARKREKKKQKRKEKQAESQTEKVSSEHEVIKPERTPTPDPPLSISPPPPECAPVVVETSKDNQTDKKRNNGNAANNKGRQQSNEGSQLSKGDSEDVDKTNNLGKENVSAKRNRRNKEKTIHRNDSQNTNKKTSSKELVKHPPNTGRITELDDFGDAPVATNSITKGRNTKRLASSVSQLDSFDVAYPAKSPNKSTPSKMVVSPSPGKKKREDASDWKQVTNKKTKRLSVPARFVSHVSKAMHTIREKSGAHLELEKTEKKSADRVVVIRGSSDALRSAQALVSTLLNQPEGESTRESNRKSNAGSTASTNSSAGQGNSRDTMSNVGMFKISDYMSTSQTTATTETKSKVVQSRPGWSVRPSPPVSQSAWGLPSGDHHSTNTGQLTSATALPQLRMPFSQPPASKQATDVSRQLFSDGRSSVSPSSANPETKPRQPVAVEESHPPASHSPGVGQLDAIQPAANLPVTGVAGPAYATSTLSMAVGSKVHSSGPPAPQSNPFFPQSFDGQLPIGAKPAMGYPMSLPDGSNRHISHPSRAPGYRLAPQASPQYQSDTSNFSKAPGARTTHTFTSEPLPPPMNTSLSRLGMEVNQMMGGMAPGGGISFGESGKASPLFMRQHYTSPNSPMTLAQPPSSLNPNASEFTAQNRFGNGAQQSPRSMSQQQPRASPIEMRANTPSYQVPGMSTEQEAPARQFLPGGQLSGGATSANNAPAVHHGPHDMPLAFSTSQSAGSHNQLTNSPPSMDMRRPVVPIGGERAEQASASPYMFSHDDIWRNKPHDEWGSAGPSSVASASSEPAIQNMFQTDATLRNFAGFYSGGAGDGLHNTWNGSPSKLKGSQGWPTNSSTWDQPNQQ